MLIILILLIHATTTGFPAGFHLLGGELKDLGGGGSSLGVGGLRVIKNKVSKDFWGE